MSFDFLLETQTKKQRKRTTIANNRRKGAAAEDQAMFEDAISGYEVERTGRGSDYVRRKRDLLTGRIVKTEHVEVKSGNAKLSPLQQKIRKKKGNYVVKRRDPLIW